MNKYKKFVKELFNSSTELRNSINDKFPGEFSSNGLISNKWHEILHSGGALFYYNGDSTNYGFRSNGAWTSYVVDLGDRVEANVVSTDIVLPKLIKLATRLGYVEGANVDLFELTGDTLLRNCRITSNEVNYDEDKDILVIGGSTVYRQGRWMPKIMTDIRMSEISEKFKVPVLSINIIP